MSSEKITKGEPGCGNFIYKVTNTVQETDENFIFQTLCNFGLQTYNIIVSKKELCAALELVRCMREKGVDICQIHTKEDAAYSRGWDAGYARGYEASMDHVIQFVERKKLMEEDRRR